LTTYKSNLDEAVKTKKITTVHLTGR
jgi:hypothetical protein